ncbi:unnamed protein product, partial [Symbiodinium necroappetens]
MSPDTKAFLILIKQQANPWVQNALKEYPQYAYRSLASTRDPLLRSSLHCAMVRNKLAGYVEDHTAKVLQQAKKELLGGLMVSIDLSKAFDLLKYSEMMLALRDTGMPEPLCRMLLHIHMQTKLLIEHGGYSRTASMHRGLRQGCCVAPMIYACWTIRLCKVLDARMRPTGSSTSGTWTQHHLSIYADDKHCHWEIDSIRSFNNALIDLRTVLNTIVELGMQISIQKSLATIALKGAKAASIMRKHIKSWNGQRSLVLREDSHDIHIPLTDEMQYLGAVLTYGNFEMATAKRRVQQANLNYAQLKPVLRTNGPLSQESRLQPVVFYKARHLYLFFSIYNSRSNLAVYNGMAPQQCWYSRRGSRCNNMSSLKLAVSARYFGDHAVLAYKWLRQQDCSHITDQDYHPTMPRRSEVLGQDLQSRSLKVFRQSQAMHGTIAQYFTGRALSSEVIAQRAANHATPWTCRLQLRNPHAMCYVNAGVLALLHCIEIGDIATPELQFLIKVGEKAATKASNLLLPQMQLFRRLTPEWTFHDEQQDTAEYLHAFFSGVMSLQAIWDSRTQTLEGIRLRAQGSQPVAIPLTSAGGRADLQALIHAWHRTEDTNALTSTAPLICLQLGRYVEAGKQMTALNISDTVMIPVFDDLSRTQWHEYRLNSAIIHLGRQRRAPTQITHSRARTQLLALPGTSKAMNRALEEVDTPMPEAQEHGFFDKYWPALSKGAGSIGDGSTAPSLAAENEPTQANPERAPKAPKTDVDKAGNGKGNASAIFHTEHGSKRRGRDSRNQGGSQWDQRQWSSWGNPKRQTSDREKSLEEEIATLKECIFSMQKLALRHEDFLCCLRAEVSWVMFLRVDMRASVVKPLYAMQQEWRDLKDKSPEKLTSTMRVALVKALFREFGKRVELLPKQEDQMTSLRKLGWLHADEMTWGYVQWDPQNERLVPNKEKAGVSFEQVAAVIASIQQLADREEAIMRFHPSRPLEQTMGGRNLTFTLQLSLFGDASNSIKEHLELLSGLAATQLIG